MGPSGSRNTQCQPAHRGGLRSSPSRPTHEQGARRHQSRRWPHLRRAEAHRPDPLSAIRRARAGCILSSTLPGYFLQRFREIGLADAALDQEGNVVAVRKGASGKPKLVVSAHLDTVFPEGTDVTVKERDGTTLAPGIGDDARGLAALLSLVQALNGAAIKTVGDVVFVGTVGEEELGNLRGVRALFRDHADLDGFISIDGLSIGRIVNQATGSHRYEMTFKGPGGHSFQEFGRPSAIHAMGR